MKLKILLLIFSIGLLFFALKSFNLESLESLKNFELSDIRITGFFSKLLSGKPFQIEASLDESFLNGNGFSFHNSSFSMKGECMGEIRMDKMTLLPEKKACEVEGNGDGEVKVENDGKIVLKAKLTSFKLNGNKFFGKNLEINLNILPTSFKFSRVKSGKLENIATGEIKRIKNDEVKSVEKITNEGLKIENFEGEISFQNSKVELKGFCTLVENNFRWTEG